MGKQGLKEGLPILDWGSFGLPFMFSAYDLQNYKIKNVFTNEARLELSSPLFQLNSWTKLRKRK